MTCNRIGFPFSGQNLSPTHNLSFYSQATGLTNNGSYNVLYVAGVHPEDTDYACHSGTIFNGGANIIASTTGSWSAKGPLLIPNATGTYTVCAEPLAGNDPLNFIKAKHTLWTFM
jgi:hypothetical protein